MEAKDVEALVAAGLPDCEVTVEGGGGKFAVDVVGEVFEGLSRVKAQQLVYGTLKEAIADGRVHAVQIRTSAPGA